MMANFIHKELADGRWFRLSLFEQLGNIGSEVGRARKWEGKDTVLFNEAALRALDLFDLTLEDMRWRGARRIEIARARELFCDAAWGGGGEYGSSLDTMDAYFHPFAYAARMNAA